jgi:hypothetical protein
MGVGWDEGKTKINAKNTAEIIILLCQTLHQLVMPAGKRASRAMNGKFKLIPASILAIF